VRSGWEWLLTIAAMEELRVVATLAVLKHLMKFVGDFRDFPGDFLFVPIKAVEVI
jgi:hypothetical protein